MFSPRPFVKGIRMAWNDSPEEWDRKMRLLRRLMELSSRTGIGASGGASAVAYNPLQDESYIAITTEAYEEITV